MSIEISQRFKDYLNENFPDLREGETFSYTSVEDCNYHCLSWALGTDEIYFAKGKGGKWPWPSIPDDTADGWIRVFEIHGFVRADDASHEPGFERVAILQDEEENLHATRQVQNGTWKSKLGELGPDIDHVNVECLTEMYGPIVAILKRERSDWGN